MSEQTDINWTERNFKFQSRIVHTVNLCEHIPADNRTKEETLKQLNQIRIRLKENKTERKSKFKNIYFPAVNIIIITSWASLSQIVPHAIFGAFTLV